MLFHTYFAYVHVFGRMVCFVIWTELLFPNPFWIYPLSCFMLAGLTMLLLLLLQGEIDDDDSYIRLLRV